MPSKTFTSDHYLPAREATTDSLDFQKECIGPRERLHPDGWLIRAILHKYEFLYGDLELYTFTAIHKKYGNLDYEDSVLTAETEEALNHFLTHHPLSNVSTFEGYDSDEEY